MIGLATPRDLLQPLSPLPPSTAISSFNMKKEIAQRKDVGGKGTVTVKELVTIYLRESVPGHVVRR